MLIPVAFQISRRTGTSPSSLLMPMAFGSLLGGMMTLIGTSPNVLVPQMRAEIAGEPFRLFAFLPVGLGMAVAGVAFLPFGYTLLPPAGQGPPSLDPPLHNKGYTA